MTNTVLITGAAKRIGRAIAEALAADGWNVAVHYNTSGAEAEALAADLAERFGVSSAAVAADLGDEGAVQALVPAAGEALGPVTCLVNNASMFEHDDLGTMTRDSWDTHMNANLRAPAVLAQTFMAQLPRGAAGNIINLLDQRVWALTPHFLSYTVSKAGLWTLTQTLAMALAPRVRVNAIGPGPVLPSSRQTQEHFDAQVAAQPLARQVDPNEIGAAARFILDAPSMTGQMIALDAGQHLGWAHPAPGTVFEE